MNRMKAQLSIRGKVRSDQVQTILSNSPERDGIDDQILGIVGRGYGAPATHRSWLEAQEIAKNNHLSEGWRNITGQINDVSIWALNAACGTLVADYLSQSDLFALTYAWDAGWQVIEKLNVGGEVAKTTFLALQRRWTGTLEELINAALETSVIVAK
jgi:hypothetical protein